MALRYEDMYDRNSTIIRRLYWCFRGAILVLVIEVAVLLVAVTEL